MTLLPLPDVHRLDPLGCLEGRSRRLGQLVASSSRRRDVRSLRSQILLQIRAMACPAGTEPRRRHYIRGACVRVGAGGLHRGWRGFHGEDPPSLRTIRSHLTTLERICALVRAPGEWRRDAWRDPAHPERRSRVASTFYLLEDDSAAEWWATVGHPRLAENPRARCNPDVWRELFAGWRREAANYQIAIPFDEPQALDPADLQEVLADLFETASGKPRAVDPEPETAPAAGQTGESDAAVELARAIRRDAEPLELLAHLRVVGCQVHGPNFHRLAREPQRLLGAAAMFLVATRRGDRIRNRSGWLVTAYDRASSSELATAYQRIRRIGGGFPNERPERRDEAAARGRSIRPDRRRRWRL